VLFHQPIESISFVALDLETTGLAPGFDQILEIGAARFRVRLDGAITPGPVFSRLVKPTGAIPPHVTKLTGITNDMVSDAPALSEVWPEILTFLSTEEPTLLLAHDARSDLSFLVAAAKAFEIPWQGPPVLCTLLISRLALPNAPRYGLQTLVNWLNLTHDKGDEPEDAVYHRALADALHARKVFGHCVRELAAANLSGLGITEPTPLPAVGDFLTEIPEKLQCIKEFIDTHKRIKIVYRGGSKGRSSRPITPLTFYQRDGVLFLRALCHMDDLPKSFRCDRISKVIEVSEST
jgi:DNA polymerase III epsilon subunit-like protein